MSVRPTRCRKVCHDTLLEALKTRSYLLSGARGKRGYLAAYHCKRCRAWHLTSQRPDPGRRRRRHGRAHRPRKGWVVGHA